MARQLRLDVLPDGTAAAVKHATGADAAELRHEAAILARLSDVDGVVDLLTTPAPAPHPDRDAAGADPALEHQSPAPPAAAPRTPASGPDDAVTVHLRATGSHTLASIGALGTPAAVQVLTTLAATVAELHRRGIAHGRIEPSHVLVDVDGRSVLCGFRAAVEVPADGSAELDPRSHDVRALGGLLHLLLDQAEVELEPIPEHRWRRRGPRWAGYEQRGLLTLADQALDDDPTRRPSAARLAEALERAALALAPAAPAARARRLPGPGRTGSASRSNPSLRRRGPARLPTPRPGPEGSERRWAGAAGADRAVPVDGPATPVGALPDTRPERTGHPVHPFHLDERADRPHPAGLDDATPQSGGGSDEPGLRRPHGQRPLRTIAPRSEAPSPRRWSRPLAATGVVLGVLLLAGGGMALLPGPRPTTTAALDERLGAAPLPSPTASPGPGLPTSTAPAAASNPAASNPAPADPKPSAPQPADPADRAPSPASGASPGTGGAPLSGPHQADGSKAPPAVATAGAEGAVVTHEGRRFAVGRAGDRVAVGDWRCNGTPTPAVLRPESGDVFVFSSWSVADVLSIDPTTRVPGARDLAPEVTPTGCARLVVSGPDGERIEVRP